MADRSQVRFETEELVVAGAIILCRRCTNSAYFFARDSATSQKSHSTTATLPGGVWKTPRLPGPTPLRMRCGGGGGQGAGLGGRRKGRGRATRGGFCFRRVPSPPAAPAALVC